MRGCIFLQNSYDLAPLKIFNLLFILYGIHSFFILILCTFLEMCIKINGEDYRILQNFALL